MWIKTIFIFQDMVCLYGQNKSAIGFHKTETLNAHNFLISGRIRKIQSSPESLFGVHKKYSTLLGSGGQIRVGRVSLNKVLILLGLTLHV